MRTSGKTTHWETLPLVGRRKATRGKAGFCDLEVGSVKTKSLLTGVTVGPFALFLLGL